MMPKALPDEIYGRLTRTTEEGSQLFDALDFAGALKMYEAAWELLPEPKEEWNAALWVLAAIGDCHFYLNDFLAARRVLQSALHLPGAIGNPFLHLRLGQTEFELGDTTRAADELIRAYAIEGPELFADQDPKYLSFLATKADLQSHRA